jgi:rod shape determining protein RodA
MWQTETADTGARPHQLTGLQRRLHLDGPLLTLLAALSCIGAVVLYSAFDQRMGALERHGARMLAGFIGMLVMAQIPPQTLHRWSLWGFLVSVVLLLVVLQIGIVGGGAQSWLDLGFFHLQPSELMKLALPMLLAAYLSDKAVPPRLGPVTVSLLLIGIAVGLIVIQPDLGTAVQVGAAGFFVLFLAGLRWRFLLGCGLTLVASLPLLWFFGMHDYQRERVLTLLNPESDPLGAGYHIIQSKIAIGSGGLYGKGWLNGTQAHLEFLPERHTDFVFSVLAEEFGFVGVLVLLALYLAVIGRGLWIASQAQTTYGRLLAGSISLTFFVYVFVNIGMVSGILPVVGLPLPLVSYGGTSMVTLLAGFGILMSIHTHRRMWSS